MPRLIDESQEGCAAENAAVMANRVACRKARAAGDSNSGELFHGFVMTGVITRFAPSPTGHLHLGHAFAAWTAWSRARAAGGRFLLRIEDIDPARCRPAFTTALQEDLHWLGLDWDGDPLVQSNRLPIYQAALDSLRARGFLYPCFCSRADVVREAANSAHAPHGPDGAPLYPGTCRALPASIQSARLHANDPHVWRLNMQAALVGAPALTFQDEARGPVPATPAIFGDAVLARRDAPASYHLCATLDDAAQSITLVTRATDLRDATHLHCLLQHLLDLPTPRYAFHRILLDPAGRRLSKRDSAQTLRALRASGLEPRALLERFSHQDGRQYLPNHETPPE